MGDFRTNEAREWRLRDAFGYIFDFIGDQHGSRFIRQKLEPAISDRLKMRSFPDVFRERNAVAETALANTMEGHILRLSLQVQHATWSRR